jgi:hypothetical protein
MLDPEPIGRVRSTRREVLDDDWDAVGATIELTETLARWPAWRTSRTPR